ncbi:hypothetical protein [Bacillus thuringiensis]|uniref:hypothetical protein n=1 Tax=Bacillus thuringiensis TaxID=1428 RepID=UPI000BFCFD60|nr:hypothetical protein [Bacillus thuringiensis]PGM34748.1 hypothetical protein CN937_29370 [Bacillus thuringiensis]
MQSMEQLQRDNVFLLEQNRRLRECKNGLTRRVFELQNRIKQLEDKNEVLQIASGVYSPNAEELANIILLADQLEDEIKNRGSGLHERHAKSD